MELDGSNPEPTTVSRAPPPKLPKQQEKKRKTTNYHKQSKSTKTTVSYLELAPPKATLTVLCLPTLIRLHVDQRQLICERNVRLGVTFDFVMQHDLVIAAWVVSRVATDLCV